MYFNNIKNELIFSFNGEDIVLIYNTSNNSHKFVQDDFKNLKYRLRKSIKIVFIDSIGIEYYIGTSSLNNNYFRLILIRDLDNKIIPIELPKELILGYENTFHINCFMSNDNKIYIMNKSFLDNDTLKPYYIYVYDHYTSDVEDDYHNKSLVFESPYPNPVGVESKVSGKFFAMPYLIKGLTMDLFDINGRKILDLSGNVNYNPATGLGSYSFSTLGLPRGMYYLLFNSSIYKDSKNIIVK